MRYLIPVALCLVTLLTPAAFAQNQQELNMAAGKDYEQADKELNAAYRQLMAKLDKDERSKLAAAERAWIKYRDADCAFEASPNLGGTIYPMIYAGAMTRRTQDRTEQLKQYLEDYAGR